MHNAIDKERMKRYWPGIKKAINFIMLNGPYTRQDRWEEEEGYTPFTLGTRKLHRTCCCKTCRRK